MNPEELNPSLPNGRKEVVSPLRPTTAPQEKVSSSQGISLRRRNKLPLYIAIGVFSILACIITVSFVSPAAEVNQGTTKDLDAPEPVDPKMMTSQAAATATETSPTLGDIPADQMGTSSNDLLAAGPPPDGALPPGPPTWPNPPYPGDSFSAQPAVDAEEQEAKNLEKEARRADTSVFNQALSQEPHSAPSTSTPKGPKGSEFFNQPTSTNHYLPSRVQMPIDPNEVKAGTIIPSIMISGINSDLPGQLIGQVAENVYDTATGKQLVIPQGSRLVGIYENNVVMGQNRILIAWSRIIFPNGASIDLGMMPGQDQAGYGGFKDKVNNHHAKVFGQAIVLSLITAGAQLSQPLPRRGDDAASFSYPQILASSLGLQLSQLGMETVRRGMNISPTLTIRPGYRFNVMITKDIVLPSWPQS
jgi:type IV secretory pathway VirB10-like protein